MSGLLNELNRRNVFRVAVFYVVVAWLLLQVTDVVAPLLQLPDWVGRLVLFMLALGFLPALVLSWIYELTPEGVKRESEIDPAQSITTHTGKRLDVMTMIVVLAAVVFVIVRPDTPSTNGSTSGAVEADPSTGRSESPAEVAESVGGTPSVPSEADSNRRSIAVLPFDNFSEDAANAFFASGVHEDILTHLARIRDLRVISRTSVEQYAEGRPPIGEIARALGVRNVVEGSVRRAGDRVRVTAQLIDATTDEHLWAESFDRDLTDVFAIQTEIARQIADALNATLSDEETALIASQPTENLAAYDLYLRAREILRRSEYSIEKFREAEPLLKSAIALDPEFALAHAELVTVHGQAVWMGWDGSAERRQAALDSARRALELDPDLPEARAAMGNYHYRIRGDFEAAVIDLEAAHAMLPSDSTILSDLGMTYRRLDRWDDSVASFRQAVALDPANLSHAFALGDTLIMLRRFDQALESVEPLLREIPDDSGLAAIKARALSLGRGDVTAALAALQSVPVVDSPYTLFTRFDLAVFEGDFDAALRLLEVPAIKAMMASDEWAGFSEIFRGRAWLGLDDSGRAEAEFERAREQASRRLASIGNDDVWAPWAHMVLSQASAFLGDQETALRVSEQILSGDLNSINGPIMRENRAWVLAMAGQSEAAIDLLEDLLEVPVGPTRWSLALDPKWDVLREHDRFRALLPTDREIGVLSP